MEDKKFIVTNENVNDYVSKIASWIKEKVESAKASGVVLGMSSGVDCSVVSALCKEANVNTHLVIMPYGQDMEKSENYFHAMELINKFKFDYHVFDIKPAVDNIVITNNIDINSKNYELSKANIRPRIRMTYLYHYAQIHNLLVIGTGNLAERTVGYFTKWGDGGCDINPVGMLTKGEMYIIAEHLQIPKSIIDKKPSADLWEGQTDEAELGFTYNDIDKYILNGTTENIEIDKLIEDKKQKSIHKINAIPIFNEN